MGKWDGSCEHLRSLAFLSRHQILTGMTEFYALSESS
jgi:hypothetical protein